MRRLGMKDKRFLLIWLVINAVIIMYWAGTVLISRQPDIVSEEVPLYCWSSECGSIGYFDTTFPEGKYRFIQEASDLEPGVYTVRIYYKTNGTHYYVYNTGDGDGAAYPAVYADDYILNPNENQLSYKLWVNDKLESLQVLISCGEAGEELPEVSEKNYLEISRVEISRSFKGTVSYEFVKLLLMLCIFNTIMFIIKKWDYVKPHFYVVLGLALIFTVSSLSVFFLSQVRGHDLAFHWGRIIGIKEGLESGVFPVKIQPGWCNDYGYAASIFYGDILLYIPAILYALNVPIVYAYKVYVLLINFFTVIIAYFCFGKISRDKYIGVTCSALYCLSVNRILNVNLRAAVGEYSAYMFFPLIVLAMWYILTDNSEEKAYKNSWWILALGMTGVIQTHTLSFEMVSLFLVIVCIATAKRILCKRSVVLLLKAVGLTVLLNVWFLVPFLDYAGENILVFREKDTYGIQWYGLSLYELFSIGTTAVGEAIVATGGLGGRFPVSLGLPILLVLIMTVILYVKYEGWKKEERKRVIIVGVLAAVALLLSTYYFPWNKLAAIKPFNSVVSSIQFPWRFVSIALPILTLLACLALMKIKEGFEKKLFIMFAVGLCVLSAYQGLQYTDMIARNNGSYTKYDGSHIIDLKEVLSGAEYLYEDTEVDEVLANEDISGENIQVTDWNRNYNKMHVTVTAEADGYLDIPMFAYPDYQCQDVNTGSKYPIVRGENNAIRIHFSDEYEGTLEISFVKPWFWTLAEIVSLVTLLGFIGYEMRMYMKERRKTDLN